MTGLSAPGRATDPDASHQEAARRDAADALASLRDRFELPPGKIYLDGNSLGALPRGAAARVADAVERQWGEDLIAGWNRHDWLGMPQRLGAAIATLVGAGADEVLVCDTTSANLFKLIAAALEARPGRRTILTEPGNFPTDLYMADAVAAMRGTHATRRVAADDIAAALDDDVALVLLTHVHFTSGRMLDMRAITRAAHAAGALVLWDLSHSAGAVTVDLAGAEADLAVGCGYKYLNGGPGAPAFLFVARRLQASLRSPLAGWLGHAAPFAFEDDYRPADGITRFLCGTPPVLGMAALQAGLETFDGVDMALLAAKGASLGGFLIARMDALCARHGFRLASPRDDAHRGSHVSFAHPHAYPICQALIARGVIGDFREPGVLRLGMAPLYTRFADVARAVGILDDIMATGAWDRDAFRARARVT